jgi:DNA replication ATP-dependent helicase Dna2
MPSFKKKHLSLYLRTGCQRQLALNLYGDKERREHSMPRRQEVRPGLGLIGKAGHSWQAEKIAELESTFGTTRICAGSTPDEAIDLAVPLGNIGMYNFVVEAKYSPSKSQPFWVDFEHGYKDRFGDDLEVRPSVPDLVQILPAMAYRSEWELRLNDNRSGSLALAVQAAGDTELLDAQDTRLRLRVIDIKQSAEPSAHYFAEVVYYSITLASWLQDNGFADRFVVVAGAAIWPGSYENSRLMVAKEEARKQAREVTIDELLEAFEADIEIAHFDVFVPRLRRFFREELPTVLSTPWDQLPWHVSYVCKGCEFLGYPWLDKDGKPTNDAGQCWPTAEATNHLSRIAGLSKGCAKLLNDAASSVGELASMDVAHAALQRSPTLRSKRTVFPYRARALRDNGTSIVPDSGGDSLMPLMPNLRIFVFLEYDLASAITAAFGVRANWREPLPYGSVAKPATKRWPTPLEDAKSKTHATIYDTIQEVYIVDQRRSPEREREELIKFLRAIRKIQLETFQQDEDDIKAERRGDPSTPEKLARSTYQIYLWDEGQRKHLVRVVGRHLSAILADRQLRDLAWLFPPPEILAHPEHASFQSPFTLIANVVQNTVAVPVAHHYTLLELVKTYRLEGWGEIRVHPLYCDPLSDLIPGERLHEMWERLGDYLQTMNVVEETLKKKLRALLYVVYRLEKDLHKVLNRTAAPQVFRAPKRIAGIAAQSLLWHEFARLNVALADLEAHSIRAMPPHEREARFRSAHLERRLEGEERTLAIEWLRAAAPQPLDDVDDLMIYIMSNDSRDVNIRPPSIGHALAPKGDQGFLNRSAYPLVKGIASIRVFAKGSIADARLTEVAVVAIERQRGIIALTPGGSNCVVELERAGRVDFAHNVMLDPVSHDFITGKVRLTLQAIGRPHSARADDRVFHALGMQKSTDSISAETPASEFLWNAMALAGSVSKHDTSSTQTALELAGLRLNGSQWEAWESALTRRLTLVWGPPGTGKSQTIRAVIAGAAWLGLTTRRPSRILISSNTYAAIDNILLGVSELLAHILPSSSYRIIRVQSPYKSTPAEFSKAQHAQVERVVVEATEADDSVTELQDLLTLDNQEGASGIIVVAAIPHQLHNLALATSKKSKRKGKAAEAATQRRWFDLIVIDEASQLDVASSTIIASKAAEGASFVLAGDDLQLAPIRQAEPPEGLEHLVGSIYEYIYYHHGVTPAPLQVNYRSSAALVDLIKRAGYDPGLSAHHPSLALSVLKPGLPTVRPTDWPEQLVWTPHWNLMLDPREAAACFLYDDEVAGQANDFEADAVAAIVWLLYGRFDQQLSGELDDNGAKRPVTGEPYGVREFWQRGVGVVTPHRAQMAKIADRLHQILPSHDPTLIWEAVDTVERFQGQQRDVIVASFGLGDPDLIRAEESFLYQLNRFNVMVSRARSKLIVLVTRSLVEHLSDNAEVLEQSRFLKYFVESFCKESAAIQLPFYERNVEQQRKGVLRTR